MLIQGLIVGAIVFGVVSSFLRRKKVLGLSGMVLAFAAILLGGASVPINQTLHDGPAIGLDWFLLDLLMMALIYVPIERLWPQYPGQGTFRPEWTLDVAYFLSTHLPVQILSLLILLPATEASRILGSPALQAFVGGLPWLVQFCLRRLGRGPGRICGASPGAHRALPVAVSCRASLVQGAGLDRRIARALRRRRGHPRRRAPAHRSARILAVGPGRLSGVRDAARDLDALQLRTDVRVAGEVPGLSAAPSLAPHVEEEAIDKNYAIHFPWIDRIFGTYYSPKGRWPQRYGLDGEELPPSFIGQTLRPFVGK